MRTYYMSDGSIYETADGAYYGITDAGSRVWSDDSPDSPMGKFEDYPEDHGHDAWQVIRDQRTAEEVED